MAKQDISVDTVYLLFEEIRAELNKLSKNTVSSQQPDTSVDLSSIEKQLENLQMQLTQLADKKDDYTLLTEIQDIKKKINNLPQPNTGLTTRQLEQGLYALQNNLTKTIESSVKSTTIIKKKLSATKLYSILIAFTIIGCVAIYYAERYYSMKRKKERLEHYYVRYRYLQVREKTTTKSDIEWLNKAPTDSIANLIFELEEKKNPKEKKK